MHANDLSTLVSLLVPAGRGVASLTRLVESLLASAEARGVARLPPLVVGVPRAEPDEHPVLVRWRAAGGTTRLVVSDAGATHATAVRNRAVAAVGTPWIGFLDDDVVVDPEYLGELAEICRAARHLAVQGVPYLCSNPEKLLARLEARNYKDGFATYVDDDGVTVRVLDARNLVLATETARAFPFDERLEFAGEGQDLADRLAGAGLRCGYSERLRVRHANRETLDTLLVQKFRHGRGRAQRLLPTGGLHAAYVRRYVRRHLSAPLVDAVVGRMPWLDAAYRVSSNTVFWMGVAYEAIVRP